MGNASDGEVCGGGVEEGFLDIAALKEVALSCREGEFISIARRFGNSFIQTSTLCLFVFYFSTHFALICD